MKLREDMNKGFELMRRYMDALGARWGLLAEEAFREGIGGMVERELGAEGGDVDVLRRGGHSVWVFEPGGG